MWALVIVGVVLAFSDLYLAHGLSEIARGFGAGLAGVAAARLWRDSRLRQGRDRADRFEN